MIADTITPEWLAGFTCTGAYHDHWLRRFVFTDGVLALADRASAHWLLDLVASHQRGRVRAEPFQVWTLTVAADRTAVAECRADTGAPVLARQRIPFTDFPLEKITLFLEGGVLMLPSER